MDQKIIYPGQIPLDTDLLYAERFASIATGRMAGGIFGEGNTAASGLACTPGSGLEVSIAPGQIIAPGVVDASALGTLAAVASALPRQYILRDATTLTVPGTGATYIVYATVATSDTAQQVLPFYNASNPTQTFAGQNNSGAALPTIRADGITLAIATSVPAGGIPLWSIAVTSGAASIATGMISKAAGAPFYRNLVDIAPRVVAPYDAALSAAISGYPLAVIVSDTSGALWVSTQAANTTTPGASGAKWSQLATEDWVNGLLDDYILTTDATVLAQRASRQWTSVTASTSVTAPAWATRCEVWITGGGGGGAGCNGTSLSGAINGGGGGAAATVYTMFSITSGATVALGIGAGGAGGSGTGTANAGGASAVTLAGSTLVSAGGGENSNWYSANGSAGAFGGTGTSSGNSAILSYFWTPGGYGSDGQSSSSTRDGCGGTSYWGGGGRAGVGGGRDGQAWGSGGGGAYETDGSTCSGGAGKQGFAIYRWLP